MDKLCRIRDLQHGIMEFEQDFIRCYGICLNEGMALCSLFKSETGALSCGEISALLNLSHSNTSKVITSIEKKGLITRSIGKGDKRQMLISLSPKGRQTIESIHCDNIPLPQVLENENFG